MRAFEFLIEFTVPEETENPFEKLAQIAKETDVGDPDHEKAIDIMKMILDKVKEVPDEKSKSNQNIAPEKENPPARPIKQIEKPIEKDPVVPESFIGERAPANNSDDIIWNQYLDSIDDLAQRKIMEKDPQIKNITLKFIKAYEAKKLADKESIDNLAKKVLSRISADPSEQEINGLISIFKQNKVTEQQMIDFLNAASKGNVIDMEALVQADSGKIDSFVKAKHRATFIKVIDNFWQLADGMRTAGNIGPGEVAFVLLGNPAEKMTKGDLKVGLETFEVKASSISPGKITKKGTPGAGKPNGAVFGAKVNQKPASAWPIVQDILNKYGIKQTLRPVTDKAGNTKELERFKINQMGLKDLNSELDNIRMPKSKRANLMADILEQLFPRIIKKDKKEFVGKVALTMDPKTGHFPVEDSSELMKLIAKTALDGYKLEKHKENFIFFNKTTRSFSVFRGEAMEQAIDDGTIKLFKGIDWSDGQYPAAPKMYLP